MNNKFIDKAQSMIKPINYIPALIGYFVLKNENDMGGPDFCISCIGDAVKESRKFHKEQREKILAKYKQIEETGKFKIGRKIHQIKGRYTDEEIKKSKRLELRQFPVNAKFSFEGHDPDFGGGNHEPIRCDACGIPFQCNFVPDIEEAKYLMEIVNISTQLTDELKWEFEIAFSNYKYSNPIVQSMLSRIAKKFVTDKKRLDRKKKALWKLPKQQ